MALSASRGARSGSPRRCGNIWPACAWRRALPRRPGRNCRATSPSTSSSELTEFGMRTCVRSPLSSSQRWLATDIVQAANKAERERAMQGGESRSGKKIRRAARPVPVQVRPPAPARRSKTRVNDCECAYHSSDSRLAFVVGGKEFMPSADQVKALISSLSEGDEAHFYSIAMQIAAHEARLGHGKVAEEIRALIDKAKSRVNFPSKAPIPIARPRGEVAELLSVSYPTARRETWFSTLRPRKNWSV